MFIFQVSIMCYPLTCLTINECLLMLTNENLLLVACRLTVEEHLWFYAKLKGMSSKDIKEEMET